MLDHFDDGINTYLVMPLCRQGSVFDLLEKVTRLPPKEAVHIALQTTWAIQYCHGQNVVVCDCKVENLLLDEAQTIKLCDFGFSVTLDTRKEPRDLITNNNGTIIYHSPQQFQKVGCDEKVDIWTLGFVLFDVLTGSPNFSSHGSRWENVYHKFKRGDLAALEKELGAVDCPDKVVDVVKQLLAVEATDRPSAKEAVALIRGCRVE